MPAMGGATWVNLSYEHTYSNINKHGKRPRGEVARRRVIHFSAGRLHREYLLRYGVLPGNVELIGSLACAQYTEPYRSFFAIDRVAIAKSHDLDPDRPWVFLPENYGAAFWSPGAVEQRIEMGFKREELEVYIEHSRSSLRNVTAWCWEIAQREDVELVIRPRPANPRRMLIDACTEAAGRPPPKNVHFIKDGTVREWIIASDLVVSSYSTSVIEATAAGKPSWFLAPEPSPNLLNFDFSPAAPEITSIEQFSQIVREIGTQTASPQLYDWTQQNLMGPGDPFETAVDMLDAICRQQRPRIVLRDSDEGDARRRSPIRNAWWRGREALRQAMIDRGIEKGQGEYEADNFSRRDVQTKTERWADILG
jgi:hypothetical protein